MAAIFIAATIYGCGKTFFWPTTLGVVSEQTPKGGALTLNAIGGIGQVSVHAKGRRAALREIATRLGWTFTLHRTDASPVACLLSLHGLLGGMRAARLAGGAA